MTPGQYDVLERAIARGERVAIRVRGAELVIVPLALKAKNGREILITRQPTTGEAISLAVEDVETVETVR